MFKERKFLKSIKIITTFEEFSDFLNSINRPLPHDESLNYFNDLKAGKNKRKILGVIFNHKCSEKEAYRREFNRPCPHCGNLEHMDSTVLDIIETSKVYKLEKICSKCNKEYITEGSKLK